MSWLWEQINPIVKRMGELESIMKQAQGIPTAAANHVKEERKDIAILKKQLEEAKKEKVSIRLDFESDMDAYIDQQSEIKTAEWIAKEKTLLCKIRTKEAASNKSEQEKCEKLMEDCKVIAQKYSSINAPLLDDSLAEPESKAKDKEKAKRKKRRKRRKEETLIGALGLDMLREQFEYFSISPPKCKEDLSQAMTSLQLKLTEIQHRPLTETIGSGAADYDSDSLSVSSLSLST